MVPRAPITIWTLLCAYINQIEVGYDEADDDDDDDDGNGEGDNCFDPPLNLDFQIVVFVKLFCGFD